MEKRIGDIWTMTLREYQDLPKMKQLQYRLYRNPVVLRWFSGNIGFHHVHHLSPRIPNYHLKKCYDAVPALQAKAPLTMLRSLAGVRLKLWDEKGQKMTGFP
jgi:acyl-lipid omega-6 desaturase (Delta-12 desaturase)